MGAAFSRLSPRLLTRCPRPQSPAVHAARGLRQMKRSFLAVGMRIVESAQPHAQPPGAPEAISYTTPLT